MDTLPLITRAHLAYPG